jgi:uncharacterized repeat protein (TIGR01451 family)
MRMGQTLQHKFIVFVLSVLACALADSWWPVLASPERAAQPHGPDLGVTMLRSADDPRALIVPGGTVTISIGVSNMRGDADAHSSVLALTLPDGLKLEQTRPAADKTQPTKDGTDLVWNLGTMAAGTLPRIFELDVTAPSSARADTEFDISATVATTDNDANQGNNKSVLSLRVKPAVADLSVESSLVEQPLAIGPPIKFTAGVSNWGTVVAAGCALTLTLPPKVTVTSSDPAPAATSGNTATWQLGDIAPAASETVAVMIALDTGLATSASESAPESPLKFKFDASTTTTQVKPANNHLEIEKHVERAGSDLKVWLGVQGADNPGELTVGKDVTYTITYGNFGNAPAQQASISLSLAEGLNLVRAEPPPAGTSKNDRFAGGVLSWNAGDLAVGQSDVIKSQVHVTSVPEDGSLVMATISAPGPSVNSGDNVAYSLRHAPRLPGHHGAAAQSGHLIRWLFFLVVLLIVLWAAFRARHRPASA